MDKVKVTDFVNAYARALDLKDHIRQILLELMENIILKYEKIVPYIPVSMDSSSVYLIKPVEGKYSVEDFFLNRLMRNIWSVDNITPLTISDGFATENTKGTFDPALHSVNLSDSKLLKQVDDYKTALGKNYEQMRACAIKKVIMHEFEHGLQTKYDDVLDIRFRVSYKKISDELLKLGKYSSILAPYESISKNNGVEHYIFSGVHYSSYAHKQGIRTYREVASVDNYNEILNESESLEIADQKAYLVSNVGQTGNMFYLRNPESSNCDITNYGNIVKELLGDQTAFVMMYLNPNAGFNKLNDLYSDIFRSEYGENKDATELFIKAITKIKETGLEADHLKLCEVLAKCLAKKVSLAWDNPKVNNEQMLATIDHIAGFSIINRDQNKHSNLSHIKILSQLKKEIRSRNLEQVSILPMPTFEALEKLIEEYELVLEGNNIVIRSIATGNVVQDKETAELATFANIWLSAAGVKYLTNDLREGSTYAFNDGAKDVYNFFISSIMQNLCATGNIGSLEIFKNASSLGYKYSSEIIVNLFRSEYQTAFLESFFRRRCSIQKPKTEETKTLYTMPFAGNLAYSSQGGGRK